MKHKRKAPVVAIDGPAGSGKSTVARKVAEDLGFIHINTGALYRASALLALRRKLTLADEDAVAAAVREAHFEFRREDGDNRILLNGEDVSDEIRRERVSVAASQVSVHPQVRASLLGLQRKLGDAGGAVLEGRDIGTVVFPDAEVKIFLIASPEERARRRALELQQKGQAADLQEILHTIEERDRRDSQREHAPLKRADDAMELDTTALTIPEVVERVKSQVAAYSRDNPEPTDD